jgi:phage terminase large subunit
LEIQISLTSKQSKALDFLQDSTTTEILYGGSAGGGKSWLGCAWLIMNCIQYPETRWLMGRSKLKALKQTTLLTFFEVAKGFGLSQEHYNYNAQSSTITFFNKSSIILKDLFTYPSDPNFDSLGSLEITGAFIDEVNQISEKAKNIVSSRIRFKLDQYGISPKLLMSCNPAKNWVYNEFYKKWRAGSLESHKAFIQALVTDNPNISKFYIQQLNKLDIISKKRLLNGEWEYEDLLALVQYDKILDLFDEIEPNENGQYPDIEGDYYISCDVARKGKDKAVILLWKGHKVLSHKILAISLTNEIVAHITALKTKYGIPNQRVVIDGDGVGGGVVDYLPGCYDFINGSSPLNGENYQNLKTQCYFKLADMINSGQILINDALLDPNEKENILAELAVVQRKNVDSDGKLQIVGKDEVKAMLGRSPDFSDALMMRMVFDLKEQVSDWRLLF